MIITNIKNFLEKNKKVFYYIFLFFIVSFLISDMTFAVELTAAEKEAKTAQDIATFFSEILKGVGVLLGLMTYLATLFLSPEWINGSLFGLNDKFKIVWIMVSNVVYFIFAFIIIWIAFMNIIGKNADQYQLKQALPKFIVGVLIVPFSWFLVQFILSISAILTISALTLPLDSFPDYKTAIANIDVPDKCTINVISVGDGETKPDIVDCKTGTSKIKLVDVMSTGKATDSIFGVISMYTYGIIGFDNVDNIFAEDTKMFKTIADIVIKIVFDVLFVLIYSILIIALGLVLMIRGIYIWIYTMLSPIFGLMYFFDKKDGGGDGFFSKFNLKEFIALSMVPVYTMLALSFGLLFMYVVGSGLSGLEGGKTVGEQEIKVTSKNDGGTINIGKFSLEIKGAVGTNANDATGFMKGIGKDGLGVVGGLILKLFGIVVLWGTVMAALRSSDVTKAIVEPLHQFGTKVGGIVSSAPGNIPIFGGQSMSSMGNIANAAQSSITTMNNDRSQSFLNKHGLFGGSESSKELRGLQGEIQKANTPQQQAAMAHKVFKTMDGNAENLYRDPEARKRIFELMGKMDVKVDGINGANDIKGQSELEKVFRAMENKSPQIFDGIVSGAKGDQITFAHIKEQVQKDKDSIINTESTNNGLTKGSSGETFADYTMGTKDIRVTINTDGTRQINVNNGAEQLGRLLEEGITATQMKTMLADMGINTDLEINNTFEEVIKSGIYYDSKTKKYSVTDKGGDFKKIDKVDNFTAEK